ncbi:hypothetical protein C8R46DRAFT_1023637 [Mycena filopes]|nr:hypothetical protein C8R46DRAFT_1023637 [Mycena filopes]
MAAELLALQSPEAFESINTTIISTYFWDWTRVPYTVFCKFVSDAQPGADCSATQPRIDEWQVIDQLILACRDLFSSRILSNEQWVRNHDNHRGQPIPWQCGLVSLDDADIVFPRSVPTASSRTIVRPTNLPGLELMCGARADQVTIQPSTAAFSQAFEQMSHGLLRNLDWANILVAGGMVLGTLTFSATKWDSSDVDIYIYGLSADEATAKIRHIYETFRNNLPSRTPTLAVRNSTTITFYAQWPLRRIQIVLKLVNSPKDVLLNFDLDICAMGWDGTNVWMLPRAARVIETGCNTFTMSLVHGHYLSDRRASQPKRIFKYADKGYGVRILPSYLSSLAHISDNEESIDITHLAADAHSYVEDMFLRLRDTHRVRYSDLDESSPARSCLTTFTLFMRHAAYWEIARLRDGLIDEPAWAYVSYEETYEDNPNSVLNRPEYKWDPSFRLSAFEAYVALSNAKELQGWIRSDHSDRLLAYGVRHRDELDGRRMSCATRIDVLLGGTHDIKTVLFLPSAFAVYANTLVDIVLEELEVQPQAPVLTPAIQNGDINDLHGEGLFVWTITSTLMWQQQDRRIDELFDILRAFCRVNTPILSDQHLQAERLVREVSKRGIGVHDEFESFHLWFREA